MEPCPRPILPPLGRSPLRRRFGRMLGVVPAYLPNSFSTPCPAAETGVDCAEAQIAAPGSRFDVVASALTINFIPDRDLAVSEMRRAARFDRAGLIESGNPSAPTKSYWWAMHSSFTSKCTFEQWRCPATYRVGARRAISWEGEGKHYGRRCANPNAAHGRSAPAIPHAGDGLFQAGDPASRPST